jgi:hypothetical protein
MKVNNIVMFFQIEDLNNKNFDLLVFILGKMFHKIGLRRYLPTGFTLVTRKVVWPL